jgi:hypothetical protein
MDLARLIEKQRFLGREFLVFLWFESELFEGRVQVPGFGLCELTLEDQLILVQEKEQSRLKSATPGCAPEAHEALRQGKLPTVARVRVVRGELEYRFLFRADNFAISGVKIPAAAKGESDEQFYERMYLVEDLEALLGSLYARFLAIRLAKAWNDTVVPAIMAWVRGESPLDESTYRKAVAKVRMPASVERPRTVPPPPRTDEKVASKVA